MKRLVIAVLLVLALAPAVRAEGEKVRGWVVGEKCAEMGRITDCYRKWSYPPVLWTEAGKTYRLELLGDGLDDASLDRAFGREVEIEGWISEYQIMVVKMTVLEASGKKEFFKG